MGVLTSESAIVRQCETGIRRREGGDGEDMEIVVTKGRFEEANLHGYVGLLY